MPAKTEDDERDVARRAGLDPELDVSWADGRIDGARYRRRPTALAQVEALAELPQLRRLGIHDVDEPFLRVIARLTKLTQLDVRSPGLTDAAAAHLASLAKLQALSLWGNNLTDAGLAALVKLTSLTELTLSGKRLRGPGLKHLAHLPRLERITVLGTSIAGDGLEHLQTLPRLREVNCLDGALTDTGLAKLAAIKTLRELRVASRRITNDGLVALRELRGLEKLSLCGMKITPAVTAEHLCSLSNLEIVFLPPSARSTAAQARVKGCLPKLQHLGYA